MTVSETAVKDTEMEVDATEETTNADGKKDQDVVHILEIREHIRKIDKAVISNEYRWVGVGFLKILVYYKYFFTFQLYSPRS